LQRFIQHQVRRLVAAAAAAAAAAAVSVRVAAALYNRDTCRDDEILQQSYASNHELLLHPSRTGTNALLLGCFVPSTQRLAATAEKR
jgi:hypothetical protein